MKKLILCVFCLKEIPDGTEGVFRLACGTLRDGEIIEDPLQDHELPSGYWHHDCLKQFDHQFHEIIKKTQERRNV